MVQVSAAVTLAMMGLIIHFILMLYTLRSSMILGVLVVIAIMNLLLRAKWGPLLVLIIIAILQFRAEEHRLVLVPHFDLLHTTNLLLIASVIGYISAQFQFVTVYDRAAHMPTPEEAPVAFRDFAAPFAWILLLPAWPFLSRQLFQWSYSRTQAARDAVGIPEGVQMLLELLWLFGGTIVLIGAVYWYLGRRKETPERARLVLNETLYGEIRGELLGVAKRAKAEPTRDNSP
jgi:hypothetical protein